MKKYISLCLCMIGLGTFAQTGYRISNGVEVHNVDCNLLQMCIALPSPRSNGYQQIGNSTHSSGKLKSVPSTDNFYVWDSRTSCLPGKEGTFSLYETFSAVLYPIRIDMRQFRVLYPYDRKSKEVKRYTVDKGVYIDTDNAEIVSISEKLWHKSRNVLHYAELCYLYVARNFRYINADTGIHPIEKILNDGGGDCGNLSSVFVNLLRARQIPARHVVSIRPEGGYHVWAEFYLEKYGWIPVDVTMKLENPKGNFFGYAAGDCIVVSVDLCHDIKNSDESTCNVPLFQNFGFWYQSGSGENITRRHVIKSETTYRRNLPELSDIGTTQAMLVWKPYKGATSYRMVLKDKETGHVVRYFDVDAMSGTMKLERLTPGKAYELEFEAMRQVGNIETCMFAHEISFSTSRA